MDLADIYCLCGFKYRTQIMHYVSAVNPPINREEGMALCPRCDHHYVRTFERKQPKVREIHL